MSKRITAIIRALKRAYPDAECELVHRTPFQLLVATILSAQCTDRKVNLVTPALFRAYPAPAALAKAKIRDVEKRIHSLGLFRNKAKHIIAAAEMLEKKFHATVPETIEELITLPGVGRKTANCVLVNAFGKPGIMADTHCIRLSGRLALLPDRLATKDAVKVELGLKQIIPAKSQAAFSHALILHGRRVCHARKPQCGICCLLRLCPYPGKEADA